MRAALEGAVLLAKVFQQIELIREFGRDMKETPNRVESHLNVIRQRCRDLIVLIDSILGTQA